MDKRTAVVTGGIGGLGTAICISLARAGRSVIATDLGGDQARIDAFLQEVDGLDVSFEALDVSDFEACEAFVGKTEALGLARSMASSIWSSETPCSPCATAICEAVSPLRTVSVSLRAS